jgi:tryptophan-rich sensory protein
MRPFAAFLLCFCVVFCVAALGSFVTLPKIGIWYADLSKPAWR